MLKFRLHSLTGAALAMAGAALVFSASGCTKKPSDAPATAAPSDPIARGRSVYQSVCTACHNADPRKSGALGPEVYGASLELLEARILRAEYPPGYTPKRATRVMVALPQVKDDISALRAYLSAP